MRDQVILARNALKNDIPLFTLVGKDKFALRSGTGMRPGKWSGKRMEN